MPLHNYRLALLSWLCVALLACSRVSPPPLTHDAYIWQRVWTPALDEAMHESAAAIWQWRVLAAQTDAGGRLHPVTADRAALLSNGKPVVLVLRIDGQLGQWDEEALLADTLALWHDWQGSGLNLAGLEIDHDCGTARLPAYAHFLGRLHAALGSGVMLSITALPAWLGSPALDRVLAQVDQSVLQVHAVRDPRAGLFDPALAGHWAREYSARSRRPFLLALPNYGSRVSWDAQGRLASVQSEAATLDQRDAMRELLVEPAALAAFLQQLQADPPAHLRGIAWFRLPTAQDQRAWSVSTWLAVIRGQSLQTRLEATARPGDMPGTQDLWLDNRGTIDAALPQTIGLPASCALADGINGYRLQRQAQGLSLQRTQPGLLRALQQRKVGWARCQTDGVTLHVET